MKNIFFKHLASVCVLVMSLSFLLTGCNHESDPSNSILSVTVLKIGKADAIAVLSNEHALLIDTGEEDDGEEVVDFLKKHSVSTVDAMIITHYDQDHVGGADTVIENLNVKDIYVPDYEGTHLEYSDFMSTVENSNVALHRLDEPVSFSFVDSNILIEPPASYEIDDSTCDYDNNFSLITTITHGKNRLVFTGDAEKQRIREWLQGDSATECDFLKVPHHGIYNKALEELFQTLNPDISVICDSQKNPADQKTLEVLHSYCPNIYETKDGNVTLISNGEKLECTQKIKK